MYGNWLKTTLLMAAIMALFGAVGMVLGGKTGFSQALGEQVVGKKIGVTSRAVQDMLEKLGYPTRVLSAITMQEITPKRAPSLARPYSFAPRFWLTKVVRASTNALMGRKPKPSILR